MTSASAELPWLWLSARALGTAAWALASATVILGLLSAAKMWGPSTARRTHIAHRTLATATLVCVVLHVIALIPDPYAHLSVVTALVPGLAPSDRLGTALGTIGLWLLVATAVAAPLRFRSPRAWRAIHVAAYAVWPLATVHFVAVGTDALRGWSLAMMGVVITAGVFALLMRGSAGGGRTLRMERTADAAPAPAAKPSAATQSAVAMNDVNLVVTGMSYAPGGALHVRLASADGPLPSHGAGQYITVAIPDVDAAATGADPVSARCYSLTSVSELDDAWTIAVRLVDGGLASRWFTETAALGTRLVAVGPSGRFVPPDGSRYVTVVTAGSGITPSYAIARHAAATGERSVHMVHIDRSRDRAMFADDIERLAADHPHVIRTTQWWTAERGRPDVPALVALLEREPSGTVMVCGPASLVANVREACAIVGRDPSKVVAETFTSQTVNPWASAPATAGADVATVTVEIDGEAHTVPWPRDTSLVTALVGARVDAPRSCLAGSCATCACTLVEGAVDVRDTGALSQDRVESGEFLGCQSRPASPQVSVRF